MYELLIIWFFCISFFAIGNIALVVNRKPSKQADKPDCVESTGLDWLNSLPDDAFVDLEPTETDEPDEVETDPEDEDESEVTFRNYMDNDQNNPPDPVPVIPRTGKVTMLAENLAKALNICKDAVGNERSCLPIIRKVLIEFKNGMASFTTTNLETAIVTRCGCKIESEFSCALPFKILKDLSELLYDDIVVIEQSTFSGGTYDENHRRNYSNVSTVTLTQGRNVCTLFDDDPQDFPPVPKIEGESAVIMDLAESIKSVKDKIEKNEWDNMKYCGLYFDLSKPNIVATDNYKMKIARLNCEPKPIQFRIDKDCALTLAKFKDTSCTVTSNDKATRFGLKGTFQDITVVTQNLQGQYCDYEALKESHKEAVTVC